jgi:hypothetical protein
MPGSILGPRRLRRSAPRVLRTYRELPRGTTITTGGSNWSSVRSGSKRTTSRGRSGMSPQSLCRDGLNARLRSLVTQVPNVQSAARRKAGLQSGTLPARSLALSRNSRRRGPSASWRRHRGAHPDERSPRNRSSGSRPHVAAAASWYCVIAIVRDGLRSALRRRC